MIRNLNIDDIESILVLENKCFKVPWSKDSFISELSNKLADYIVMEENHQIVAYLGIWYIIDQGHITNIAVHPEHRGRGYAKELIDTIIQRAKERNCDSITLEVRKSNVPAIRLYESKGFISAGIRPKYYENIEDAIIMWMEIK